MSQRCLKKKQRATLATVLRYRNPDVLDRYLKDFGGTRKEAEHVFQETLKWLYLIQCEGSTECCITGDLTKIDDMWHTFILFTPDYTAFCRKLCGYYLHHQPTTGREPRISAREQRRRDRRYLELVYDTLGEETFQEWFFSGRFERRDRSSKISRAQS
jgi:hypothetical protein